MGLFKNKKELSQAIGKNKTYVGDIINMLNMDIRIVNDILKNNTIRDVKILRSIRKVARPIQKNTDSNFKSEKQWKLYRNIIDKGLTREEVNNIVEKIKDQNKKKWVIENKIKSIKIKIDTSNFSANQRELIYNSMNTKLKELEKSLNAK